MISLKPSDNQRALVDAIDGFVRAEMPVERLRSATPASDFAFWRRLGEFGVFALTLAEEQGGVGCGIAEELLVYHALGRKLVSPAAIASSMAARLALGAGQADLAKAFASGRTTVGFAIPADPTSDVAAGVDARLIECADTDWAVLWGSTGISLARCERFSGQHEAACIDGTIHLVRARFAGGEPPVGNEEPYRPTLLVAAMLCGAAEAAMEMNVEYMKVREQFGQPLGAFQSVKHRCADMAKRNAAAWSQTCFAALMLQADAPDAAFQMRAAKILAAKAGVENAEAAIQNFGAIGFTAEHSIHHFLKRAHVLDMLGGSVGWQQRRFMGEPHPLAAA
ncbi:MAG: acyl-CoA dehydrogenase family protein [Novosphingobium sp.]